MAWAMLKEGWTSGWDKVYIKVKYETTRSGSSIAVRYRIEWEIKVNYYYGYPIKAYTYSEGGLREDITLKNASPSTGSGAVETGWYWHDKGYSDNNLNNCRVYVYSTLGGSAVFETGWNTLVAPQGALASTISSNIDFTIGNNIPITINDPTNLGYNYSLFLYVNGVADVVTMTTTLKSFTWIFTQAQINAIYSKLPNQNSAGVTIYLATYLNGTHIGTTNISGTCYVANSNPTLSGFTYLDTSIATNVTGSNQKLLQNKSTIQITAGTVQVFNSATFSKYSAQIGSRVYESTSNVINIGTTIGEENIILKAIDSRGNFASVTKTIRYSGGNIELIPYDNPAINTYTSTRISGGTSATVSVNATAKVAKKIRDNSQYVTKTRYKELPSGAWSSYSNVANTIDINGNITLATNIGSFDINKSFIVELAIDDYFTTTKQEYTVPSAKMLLSMRKDMIGINMIPEAGKGALQINGGISIDGNSAGSPTGSIQIWAHGYATIPVGWLVLEGQAVSRTTYSKLYTLVSTLFGAGDGSTTFNLPDFRGRVPVGYNGSDANFNAVGKKVGSSTHTLSTAETPSHNHTGTTSNSGWHGHSMRGWRLTNNSGSYQVRSREDIAGDGYDGANIAGSGDHNHTFTTSSVGSGSAHNNLQPSIAMLCIIKY